MILHYAKVALRSMNRFKMQNAIAILGLAVSLFCFSICLYCSRYIFGTDDCFSNKDRIIELNLYGEDEEAFSGTSGKLAQFLRDQNLSTDAFCNVTYSEERQYNIEVSDDKILPYELEFIETDSVFNKVFTPQIVCGSWEQASNNHNAVIMFESTAKRIFGSAEKAIGKRMILSRRLWSSPRTTPREGGISYTIYAVAKDLPLNTSLNFLHETDALSINDTEGLVNIDNHDITGAHTYALDEGKHNSGLMDEINKRNLVCHIFGKDAGIRAERFGTDFWDWSVAPYFANVTLIAGILVLLVGLLNFLHFMIGSFFTRVRECNIRRVNGAGFKELFMMFFVQISIPILLSVFFTFLFIEVSAPFLHLTLVRFSITIDPHLLMWQTLTYLLGLMLLCVVISLFVIVKVRKSYAKPGLYEGIGGYGKHRMRNLSLAAQLFIGWIFLSLGTALYLQSVNTGNAVFDTLTVQEKDRILGVSFDYPFMDNNTKKALVEEFRKCRGVEDVLISDVNYLGGTSGTGLFLSEERDKSLDANVMRVTPNFFRFMNVDIMSGGEQKTLDEMVIDDVLAKRIGEELLGNVLYDWEKGYTLVGITEHFSLSNYKEGRLAGYMFVPSDFSDYIGHCYVKCIEGREEEAVESIKALLGKTLPESVEISAPTMMDDIREEYALEFKLRGIVLLMAFIALLISMLGVYSAITLDTENRRKEMAIRKINGAGVRQIVMLFAKLYVTLVISTALVAFPVIEILLRMFSTMYNSFIETGILFYGGIFLSVVLLITVTVYVRIKNIARVNPAEIIKTE